MSDLTLLAAAGNAATGEATYVEDVFSTYLYEGNAQPKSIQNNINLNGVGSGSCTAFEGTSQYFSRSSDLTGNANGRAVTLSLWVDYTYLGSNQYLYWSGFGDPNYGFTVFLNGSGNIYVRGYNTSGSKIFEVYSSNELPQGRLSHVLLSFNLGSASQRHLYVNDQSFPATWSTYVNQDIDFTKTTHNIGGLGSPYTVDNKIAHLYLDYTYRDLSTESNRRNFIDAGGGSTSVATQSALSPIIYIPMTDGYTQGENQGTGGDFTVTGSPTIDNTSGTEWAEGGKGGLVWVKNRDAADFHVLADTERGPNKNLKTDSTAAETTTVYNYITGFYNKGFTIGASGFVNTLNESYASWTFAKQEKFFDVVTYTGNGTAGRTVSHNLGSTPGCIIVKRLNATADWCIYHRGVDATSPENYFMKFNTDAREDNLGIWNDTAPTSTEFTVGSSSAVNNGSGGEYVAYLFAHNDGDGIFGENGDQDIIKCGSYTGNQNSDGPEINLGFEPQWIMIKGVDSATSWVMVDVMRGIVTGDLDSLLFANGSNAELTGSYDLLEVTPTGFKMRGSVSGTWNNNNEKFIYIAIRRGPMKTPESGTEVFTPYISDATTPFRVESGFPVDSWLYGQRTSTNKWFWFDRIRGSKYLKTNTTSAETAYTAYFDDMEQASITGSGYSGYINYAFRRAPGFFDVVAYTGTGTEPRTVYHNLGVAPEMIWTKRRDSGSLGWVVWHKDLTTNTWLRLDSTQAETASPAAWGGTFSADNYTIANDPYDAINGSGGTLIAYLFATVPGVSKVGSYTGNGTSQTIDCGFSAGARFVLIKRTDSTGDWHVYDSERGIVAGNDPRLELNTTDAEDTGSDDIDPVSSGFAVTSNADVNTNGAEYIFLAIA